MKKTTSAVISHTALHLLSLALIFALLLPAGAGWAANQPPLKKIPVPVPRTNAELVQFPILAQYVKDIPAAIALGKALFWDMQAGSDGLTACATCHYKAGADPIDVRSRNQLHPGPDNIFQVLSGPSNTLTSADFPFFQVLPPTARLQIDPLTGLPQDAALNPVITRNFNDVTGSQGVLKTNFTGINPGNAVDNGTLVTDQTFSFQGQNVRQVTGRNSPSVINAVYSFTQFWDGRGNNIFNGVNPFGPADQSAVIWRNAGGLVTEQVRIPNASLASQAVGPPLNDVEMSYAGRTFPEFGSKMLSIPRPLNLQVVDPADSVLGGALSRSPATGLNTSYTQMIQAAFVDNLWNGGNVTIDTRGVPTPFTQMEANFSLFWGLSIMLYEATLVSDQTPFDRFVAGNQNAMSLSAQGGQTRFNSQCARCHSGAELTNAAVGTDKTIGSSVPDCLPGNRLCNSPALITKDNHNLIQLDRTLILGGLSDTGFMNLGLRPMIEDAGRGDIVRSSPTLTNPNTNELFPLSFTLLAQLQAQGLLPFETPSLNTPLLVAGLASAASPTAIQGSFKTPGIRNVELSAPYFHNGSMIDLQQVVEFYARGGNFPNTPDNPTLAKDMNPIGGLRIQGGQEQIDMVNFLRSLTDERVRNDQAPFDHPELRIPSGDPADTMITLPAKGGAAAPVLLPTFTLITALTATQSTNIVIGGIARDSTTNNDMVTVEVIVNGLPGWTTVGPAPNIDAWSFTMLPAPLGGMKIGNNTVSIIASTPDATQTIDAPFDLLPTAIIFGAPLGATNQTSATMNIGGNGVTSYRFNLDNGPFSAETPTTSPLVLSGLPDGFHTLSVLGTALVGAVPFAQPAANATTAIWRVKTIPPVLTLNPVPGASGASLTISGSINEVIVPQVSIDTGATAVCSGTTAWTCQISGLTRGQANITIKAIDIAQNVSSATASVRIILPDGDFRDKGTTDISDAVKALRIAVGTDPFTLEDVLHGDVAPLVNNVPEPDGTIGVDDALIILKKVAGLVNF